ncbi:Pycsar system effector family protein [Aliarcobacter butzleri]|uniref:Pycsar system effector family protein n=1 Tax=Aliarcobacter butzleri TaxID=28197 RepID=UPI003AF74B1F
MKNEEKIQLLKFNISRFDHYYASVNFKSSFLVLGNLSLFSFLFLNKTGVNGVCIILSSVLSVLSLVFTLLAIAPYLKGNINYRSNIFFGEIANKTDFKNDIENLQEKDYLDDLIEQNKYLSIGLKNKFELLNKATWFFIFNIIVFLFTIIIFV